MQCQVGHYRDNIAAVQLDSGLYTHIDLQGQRVYSRRFAAIEPFNNGQARVEAPGGLLLVINESGVTVAPLRE